MNIKDFKKAYEDQIAAGQKLFNRLLLVPACAIAIFSMGIWYLPDKSGLYLIFIGTIIILFFGIILCSIGQVLHDIKIKSIIPGDIKPVYLKYVIRKGILGFLITSGLYALGVGFIIMIA